MDNIKGSRSNVKERLLTEDFLSLPLHRTRTRTSRCLDLLNVGVLITAVLACIVSIVCAVYCQKALANINKIHHDTENGMAVSTGASTHELPMPSELGFDLDSSFEASTDFDYELLDEEDMIESDDSFYDDVDVDVDGSGSEDIEEQNNVRRRRSVDRCEEKCRKSKSDRQKNKCLTRCNTGNRNTKKTRKSKKAMDLPAAQFEVKFTDQEIEDKVHVAFNSYVNKDMCSYVQELDGTLCSNRTYIPEKTSVPLDIYKAASWVDDKKSPVKFNNAVAHVKAPGIYLVYAQAYMKGNELGMGIAVVQKRGSEDINALSCRAGEHPDYNDTNPLGELQTCSVLGLMYLEKGDTIEVQKKAATATIILDKDKTYFGLVQIRGVIQSKTKKLKN